MKLFSKKPPAPIAPAGLHHYRILGRRLHLRVGRKGTGVLSVDASKIIHLNRTACDMAWLILEGVPAPEAARRITRRYRTGRGRAAADLAEVGRVIEALARGDEGDGCPVTSLGLDRLEPYSVAVEAPYRADLALTYRCNIECLHCYNGDREVSEMDTGSWKRAISLLWDAGVPHVAFTGGEATLRSDLADLIAHAESTGMVSGLLTNGVALADRAFLDRLKEAGLDYVQVTLESPVESVHNSMTGSESYAATLAGLRNAVDAGLYAITNTTLTRMNAATALDMPAFLAGAGLRAFAMNSIIHSGKGPVSGVELPVDELTDLLCRVRDEASAQGIRMIWYSPTRYCELDPVDLGLGPKHCTAGQYNVCIEPNGDVIPCQSFYKSAGNILTDPWDSIYGSPLMRSLREREWIPEGCRSCNDLQICGGGCPLDKGKDGVVCPDMLSNP